MEPLRGALLTAPSLCTPCLTCLACPTLHRAACPGGRCASEREALRRGAAAAPAAPARLGELIAWGALPQRCREGARTVRVLACVRNALGMLAMHQHGNSMPECGSVTSVHGMHRD